MYYMPKGENCQEGELGKVKAEAKERLQNPEHSLRNGGEIDDKKKERIGHERASMFVKSKRIEKSRKKLKKDVD